MLMMLLCIVKLFGLVIVGDCEKFICIRQVCKVVLLMWLLMVVWKLVLCSDVWGGICCIVVDSVVSSMNGFLIVLCVSVVSIVICVVIILFVGDMWLQGVVFYVGNFSIMVCGVKKVKVVCIVVMW